MNTNQAFAPGAIECPKCGKRTVVLHSADVYQCLNCDFRRDLSEHGEEPDDKKASPLLAIALAVAALLMLL
ncbi:MAG: hypothetical protein ACFB8W_02740 [Elainellaceae cyanobacterium]